MRHDVVINGRTRKVEVRRLDGGFAVAVDGQEHTVDVARIDAHTLSLLVGASSHEVTIVPDTASGQLTIQVGAVALAAELSGRRRWGRKDDGAQSAGPQRLSAPMPGRVVRVLVRQGETVTRGQPLVVVEAMKMENELRASRDGAVTELFVKEGQLVDAGAPLAVVAPS